MAPTMTMPMSQSTTTVVASSAAAISNMAGTDMNTAAMDSMDMTFFFSDSTALFAEAWKPQSTAAYLATCLFLVMMAFLMRFLLALKPVLEQSIWKVQRDSRTMLLWDEEDMDHAKGEHTSSSSGGFSRILFKLKSRWQGWTFTSSASRALLEVLLAVIGYLLMLSVMTMNIGYFIAVIVGVFIGTLVLGHLATSNSLYQEHHC